MTEADARAALTGALRRDLLRAALPEGPEQPTERDVAALRRALHAMVGDCEGELRRRCDLPPGGDAWSVLARSGLLDDPVLVDAALMRIALVRMTPPDTPPVPHDLAALAMPAEPVGAADPALRHLAALSRTATLGHAHRELDAPGLHRLVWRVVAALEVEGAAPLAAMTRAAEAMLADHDEGAGVMGSATALAQEVAPLIADPARFGAPLFLASLATVLDVPPMLIVEAVLDRDPARLCVLMRAGGLDDAPLFAVLDALFAPECLPPLARLHQIERHAARRLVQRWGQERQAGLDRALLARLGDV